MVKTYGRDEFVSALTLLIVGVIIVMAFITLISCLRPFFNKMLKKIFFARFALGLKKKRVDLFDKKDERAEIPEDAVPLDVINFFYHRAEPNYEAVRDFCDKILGELYTHPAPEAVEGPTMHAVMQLNEKLAIAENNPHTPYYFDKFSITEDIVVAWVWNRYTRKKGEKQLMAGYGSNFYTPDSLVKAQDYIWQRRRMAWAARRKQKVGAGSEKNGSESQDG